jgi:hypothetical protein
LEHDTGSGLPHGPQFTTAEMQLLHDAAMYLERPRLLIQLANLVGKPAEGVLRTLPSGAQRLVTDATHAALARSLRWALHTLPSTTPEAGWRLPSGGRLHTALAAATGAAGGLFGLAGAAIEVPTTTTIMLRSIAEIALRHDADLNDPGTRLHCLAVFSYGAPPVSAMESAYISSRLALGIAMRDATRYLATHSAQEVGRAVSQHTAPVMVRLIQQIAQRFQIVVTEKMAATAVPIAGAAMGSLINAAFTDHFNRVAEFHFGIVQLERRHGAQSVQSAYRQCIDAARVTAPQTTSASGTK